MAIYMISYDLAHPEYNNKRVKEEIEALGSWSHYLDATTYLIDTIIPNKDIENVINKHLTNIDRLTICEIDNPKEWLANKNIKWKKGSEKL